MSLICPVMFKWYKCRSQNLLNDKLSVMIIAIIDVMERALNDLLTQTGGVIGSIRDEQLNFGKDIFITPHTIPK